MKDAQKPDHVSLNTLIGRLREGRYVIPDFQREFEWKPWDIRDLMRSIFLDYYIGSILLWKGKKENFEALSCEAIYGFSGTNRPEYIVLDGQQRLTALHYAFVAPDKPLPNRANRYFYFIRIDKFMAEQYDESFGYDWLTRRWDKILRNADDQYAEHLFPLSIIGKGGWDLFHWLQGYEKFWGDQKRLAEATGETSAEQLAGLHAENGREFGEHLRGITEQYQVSYIELDQDLGIDKVCDIFTQINSKGIQLDTFDLINALLKPKGLQLKQMWRQASPRLDFIESDQLNIYILQVMSILRQGYCSPKYLYFLLPGQEKPIRNPDGTRHKEVLVPDTADFEKGWKAAVDALEAAIKLLRHPQEFGAISSKYLPYVSILPAFAALQTHVKTLAPTLQLDAQRKIRHWYWASVFMNRYSGSVETMSARDFIDVKGWLPDDDAEPAVVLEFKSRFRNLDFRKELKRGTSIYNGIFNLLVIQGARDWTTGQVPQHDDLDDHHIVPSSWGKQHLGSNAANTILNRTPLSADTNRNVIRDRLPNEYLPEMMQQNGESAVRAILESHFISPTAQAILLRDPFMPDDFDDFISERQRTFQDAIENLLIKERLDLAPQLRDLDARIEQIELKLRELISVALVDDPTKVPPHVNQKAEERIQTAARKSAAVDVECFRNLTPRLQYFDLRELQETILSKGQWHEFEIVFVNKETLNGKFSQLAELRNGIRHSRNVSEIARMEGEAAILWFEHVLTRRSIPSDLTSIVSVPA